jgi:hypothetical protein
MRIKEGNLGEVIDFLDQYPQKINTPDEVWSTPRRQSHQFRRAIVLFIAPWSTIKMTSLWSSCGEERTFRSSIRSTITSPISIGQTHSPATGRSPPLGYRYQSPSHRCGPRRQGARYQLGRRCGFPCLPSFPPLCLSDSAQEHATPLAKVVARNWLSVVDRLLKRNCDVTILNQVTLPTHPPSQPALFRRDRQELTWPSMDTPR